MLKAKSLKRTSAQVGFVQKDKLKANSNMYNEDKWRVCGHLPLTIGRGVPNS